MITPYKLASRELQQKNTVVKVGSASFGGNSIPVIAGPCAIESYEQLYQAGVSAKAAGAAMLRGGAYKPRTSPYSFQGLEKKGLEIIKKVGRELALPVISEVTDPRNVELMAEYVDMLQIGTRNMQNFVLLKEAALSKKPVLLKRGLAATIEEWLMAAEYILSSGNNQIVLCERGIRTYEPYTRNTLDLTAVPIIKHLSHLPVIVDPSHGTGSWRWVSPMAKAAIAAGADGLLIEMHQNPEEALSDGPQSLTPENFARLMVELSSLTTVLGRSLTTKSNSKEGRL
ncbi:Phospho-2-dehydro-3-deoxyheptonate aldolase [Sporomusa ovata DSM 2662]|uniref:2-keto-3-deoxy-D-arabino-heptulosonate-7-phosphate synthase I beta n=1 Tax=Sporomusa ovata TaxID=2378 RepID=A0A0U1L587_9FIRM|nr:phospho-2-dehydro-3-deoxyheptonate aldolase [Sporomusa ovata DSM 2662]CQR74333.1 2-keto-3-deoxy-D-arabino-heptulosonate-7-phosphate synthase I beta [Sporomusa ovata]